MDSIRRPFRLSFNRFAETFFEHATNDFGLVKTTANIIIIKATRNVICGVRKSVSNNNFGFCREITHNYSRPISRNNIVLFMQCAISPAGPRRYGNFRPVRRNNIHGLQTNFYSTILIIYNTRIIYVRLYRVKVRAKSCGERDLQLPTRSSPSPAVSAAVSDDDACTQSGEVVSNVSSRRTRLPGIPPPPVNGGIPRGWDE